MTLDACRSIADAVLYEGYLLYPYRASSSKNRSRWQFGVLGPPRASAGSFAEAPGMSFECLLEPRDRDAGGAVSVHLRFLQVQTRSVEMLDGDQYVAVDELVVDGRSVLSWDEAVECERMLPAYDVSPALAGSEQDVRRTPLEVPAAEEAEPIFDSAGHTVGRIVRRRARLWAEVGVAADPDDCFVRVTVSVDNVHPDDVDGKDAAIRASLIGTHALVVADGATFVSLLDPPAAAAAAAGRCSQDRCFPVLVGPPGSRDVVLGSPIILYDHPEIAEQSAGALFDSTEIDEILTLRVMTMTEAEKAEARATDPRAAEIIDRCDQMSPDTLGDLHGVLRDADAAAVDDVPWWDPAADETVQPETDSVSIAGVPVAKGSLVRVHPSRRADAQDLFFADQVARVTAVLSDVDGETHVAVVLVDDPAADMHEWYGRYFYFGPEELEPLSPVREESRP